MKRELYNKWIAALESGEYKKGKYSLNKNNLFCCLGVLCEIIHKESPNVMKYHKDSHNYEYKGNYNHGHLSYTLTKELKFYHNDGATRNSDDEKKLTYLNDSNDTFEQVIKVLKENPEDYFILEDWFYK